ncbi:LysR family transcriptional regulator [Pseudomonas sp. NPDC086251]|uniref:LysR family transcriptional regulator n=1 Tax=Pseudomonas sp. NPDC086251 TaxID=3364431 RepID=UPI003835B9CA
MVDRIQDMKLFRLVVQTGSLSAAGRHLGLSPAAMSGRLKAMEDMYGLPLLKRNSRSLTPTEEGQYFYEKALLILEEVDALDSTIKGGQTDLSGTIGLTCPTDLGRQIITPMIDAFIEEHPQVNFRLFMSDRVLNFVEFGLDLAIRWGTLPDSSLTAYSLGIDRPMVCCSPMYIEKHGAPRHLGELQSHNCFVQLRADEPLDRWGFMQNGAQTAIQVKGNRLTDDGSTLRKWAVQGLGIIRKGVWEIADDLDAGRLVPLLEEFHCPTTTFHLVADGGRQLPTRVRSFVDFTVDYFKHLDTPARHHLIAS